MIRFVVPGEPYPKERHRTSKNGHRYNPSEEAEDAVRAAYIAIYGHTEPKGGVLWKLNCTFYTKNRRTKDVDNLWKLFADALQGLVWKNDSHVWHMGNSHREVDKANPRTVVEITEL